jgi:hypothetical protein
LVVGVPEAAERVLGLARVAIPEDDPMCGIRPVPGPRTLSLMLRRRGARQASQIRHAAASAATASASTSVLSGCGLRAGP